jgi:hypothetical protein
MIWIAGAAATGTSAPSNARVEKRFFVSLRRTEYVRETPVHNHLHHNHNQLHTHTRSHSHSHLRSSRHGLHHHESGVGLAVVAAGPGGDVGDGIGVGVAGNPIHKLVVDNLRGAWTVWNKDVVMSLIDGWRKSQVKVQSCFRCWWEEK